MLASDSAGDSAELRGAFSCASSCTEVALVKAIAMIKRAFNMIGQPSGVCFQLANQIWQYMMLGSETAQAVCRLRCLMGSRR